MAWLVSPREDLYEVGKYPAVLDSATDKHLKAPNVTRSNFRTYSTHPLFSGSTGGSAGPRVTTFA